MTTDIWFYHLTRSPLEQALPKVLEKAYSAQLHTLILSTSEERMELLNREMWTYNEHSFLPHGTMAEAFVTEQPILISTNAVDVANRPNQASLLVLVDQADAPSLEGYDRVLYMFDGADAEAVSAARSRWKAYKDDGHTLAYWQQNERGGWDKKQG